MQVSIILLNYNGKQFNKACIDSILKQSYQDFEIVFVDNVSTDGSVEEVESLYTKQIAEKKIKIIRNTKNTGFAGGNNLGIEHISNESEYICLLNNDTTVPKDRLEELVKGIESDKKLGAVGSLVLDKGHEDDVNQLIFGRKKKPMLSVFGETIIEPIQKGELENGILYTNGLSGCCFMYKKNIIKRPFEDFYFAYAEDVYLSWSILSLGYKLGISTNSIVNHFGSGSFGKKPSPVKLLHGNKNQIINFIVFYRIQYKILLFPIFLIKEIGHLFLGHSISRLSAKIKGGLWIFKHWHLIRQTIYMIRDNSKISNKTFLKKMYFKLSDITYFNKQPIAFVLVLKFINIIFSLWGSIIKLI